MDTTRELVVSPWKAVELSVPLVRHRDRRTDGGEIEAMG